MRRRPATVADTPSHRDEVAIIARELVDLGSPDAATRHQALATIRQAVHRLDLIEPSDDACARLTHEGGHGRLLERYRTSQDEGGQS